MFIDKFASWVTIIGWIQSCLLLLFPGGAIPKWMLAVIFIIFIFLIGYFYTKHNKDKRYLKGEQLAREFQGKMRHQTIKGEGGLKSLGEMTLQMSEWCSDIAEVFTTIGKKKIGVCVKYLNGENENPYVKTLCRDRKSKNDGRSDKNNGKDLISLNSDFSCLFEMVAKGEKMAQSYYCANCLPYKFQYVNTHIDTERLSGCFLLRWCRWSLPYKSTIVVPIISVDGRTVYAFLCIDSPSWFAFNAQHDVGILQSLALSMTDMMRAVCENYLRRG